MSTVAPVANQAPRLPRSTVALCAAIAALAMGCLHALQRDLGFTFQDEGYLWYGTQAVLRGEMPLRDFSSYDPGRYLWCAAWGLVLGPGLLTVRLACAVFAALGLTAGLLVAARALRSAWMLLPAGLALALWIQPTWKNFEPAIAMAAVLVGTLLVERPSRRMHFAAGVFAGLAAFMGRNHGVYVCIGQLALIALVALRTRPRELPRRLTAWAGGVAIGYTPMLVLIAFAPGFGEAFVESVAFFAQQGHLSGKKPVPWPWRADYASLVSWQAVHVFAVGLGYLLIPIYYLPSLVGAARTTPEQLARWAPWLAATLVGAPYVHHAWTHAAHHHLAQAIHPLLLGVLALPLALSAAPRRTVRALVVAGVLALAAAANVPGLELTTDLRTRGTRHAMRPLDIGGEVLRVQPEKALYLELLRAAVERNVPDDEEVFLAPIFPGLYCMLGRTSPTWDIYLAWVGTGASQRRLVQQLEAVDWALLADVKPGGEEWLRPRNTNPEVWAVLQRDFEPVPLAQRMPRNHVLMRRKSR